MFYIYVIKSVNRNYIYVGLTANFDRRFYQHNEGKNKTTRPYRPFDLVIKEVYNTRLEARNR